MKKQYFKIIKGSIENPYLKDFVLCDEKWITDWMFSNIYTAYNHGDSELANIGYFCDNCQVKFVCLNWI